MVGWVLLLLPASPWLLGGLGVGILGDGDIAVSVSEWLYLVAMLALVASPVYLPALAISTFGLAASVVCAYRWPAHAPSVSRVTARIAWLGLLAVPVYLLVVLAR